MKKIKKELNKIAPDYSSNDFVNFFVKLFDKLYNTKIRRYINTIDILHCCEEELTIKCYFTSDKKQEVLDTLNALVKSLNIEYPMIKSYDVFEYEVSFKLTFKDKIFMNVAYYESRGINLNGITDKKKIFALDLCSDDRVYYLYAGKKSVPMTMRNVQWMLDTNKITKTIIKSVLEWLSGRYIIFKDVLRDIKNRYSVSTPFVINKMIELNPPNKKMLFEVYYKYPFDVPTYVNKLPITESYIKLKTLRKIQPNMRSEFMHFEIPQEKVDSITNNFNSSSIPIDVISYYYEKKFAPFGNDRWKYYILSDYLKMSYKVDAYFDLNIKTLKSLTNKHNEIIPRYIVKVKSIKLKIPNNTPLSKLELPDEFEKITTGKRLKEEGIKQSNCVYGYADEINKGKCVIYSTEYEGHRYTIEIRYTKKKGYYLNQCLGYKNIFENEELNKKINKLLREENKKLNQTMHDAA